MDKILIIIIILFVFPMILVLWKTKKHYYYLENKLEFLSVENEWYFDNGSKYLYVRLPNDETPDLTKLEQKFNHILLTFVARV